MTTVIVTSTLQGVTCCTCGVLFGLTSEYIAERRRDHEWFRCPNGHSQHYSGETEAEKLARQLKAKNDELARVRAAHDQTHARLDSARAEVRHQERRINGYKGVVARVKRRVSSGSCPCCSMKFKNLREHMQTEHPGWNPEKGADALGGKS